MNRVKMISSGNKDSIYHHHCLMTILLKLPLAIICMKASQGEMRTVRTNSRVGLAMGWNDWQKHQGSTIWTKHLILVEIIQTNHWWQPSCKGGIKLYSHPTISQASVWLFVSMDSLLYSLSNHLFARYTIRWLGLSCGFPHRIVILVRTTRWMIQKTKGNLYSMEIWMKIWFSRAEDCTILAVKHWHSYQNHINGTVFHWLCPPKSV